MLPELSRLKKNPMFQVFKKADFEFTWDCLIPNTHLNACDFYVCCARVTHMKLRQNLCHEINELF